jgi:hypothetical protein
VDGQPTLPTEKTPPTQPQNEIGHPPEGVHWCLYSICTEPELSHHFQTQYFQWVAGNSSQTGEAYNSRSQISLENAYHDAEKKKHAKPRQDPMMEILNSSKEKIKEFLIHVFLNLFKGTNR